MQPTLELGYANFLSKIIKKLQVTGLRRKDLYS